MAEIKAYTDLSQSKKLAEILPLGSADMTYYACVKDWRGNPVEPKWGKPVTLIKEELALPRSNFQEYEYVAAWSLAALLEQITKHGILDLRFLYSTFDNKGTHLTNVWNLIFEDIGNVSLDIYADNPIDACYEIILRLNELNML